MLGDLEAASKPDIALEIPQRFVYQALPAVGERLAQRTRIARRIVRFTHPLRNRARADLSHRRGENDQSQEAHHAAPHFTVHVRRQGEFAGCVKVDGDQRREKRAERHARARHIQKRQGAHEKQKMKLRKAPLDEEHIQCRPGEAKRKNRGKHLRLIKNPHIQHRGARSPYIAHNSIGIHDTILFQQFLRTVQIGKRRKWDKANTAKNNDRHDSKKEAPQKQAILRSFLQILRSEPNTQQKDDKIQHLKIADLRRPALHGRDKGNEKKREQASQRQPMTSRTAE